MTIKQHGGIFGRNPQFQKVSLPDGGQVNLGNSDDLSIYHSGSASHIVDSGTGNLFVQGNNLALKNADGSKSYLFAANGGDVSLYYDGAVKFQTKNGGAKVVGDLAFNSGQGIDFSATSGTGTSELFDDYEEGTWTPVLTFGGASTGITYSHQTGLYTKIGNVVKFELRIRVSSVGTATGDAKITGLPFSPTSSLNGYVGRQYLCSTTGITATTPVGIIFDTSTIIDLYENPGSSLARLNNTDFTTNDYLTITGSYTAA